MPCSSQAAMVSSSRFEPPGWMMAVTPGGGGDVGAVAEREEGVGGEHGPAARSPAFSTAIRTESSRLIWPAPTPTSWPSFASTIAFDLTAGRPARRRPGRGRSASVGGRRGGDLARRPGRPRSRPSPGRAGPPRSGGGRSPRGAGRPGPIGPSRSSRRTLFFQVGLVVSSSRASGSKPGATIASMNRPGDAEPLGRRRGRPAGSGRRSRRRR